MAAPKVSAAAFFDQIRDRHSFYGVSKDLTIGQERIQDIVKEALDYVPSAFNSQSNRAVVLLGAEHERLWDMVAETLKAHVDEDKWEATGQRMAMFRGAAGTVLFLEDQAVVEGMQARFPTYADKFPVWASHSGGMLQFATWVALEAEGLGASLQHYNPLVDDGVAAAWKLPATWKLQAQLVFGGRGDQVGKAKDKKPHDETFRVFGA